MNWLKCVYWVGVLALSLAALPEAPAGPTHSSRQYYSSWRQHSNTRYHYRKYYYKPRGDYVGFKHHYVVHDSKRPNHLYFYNPYKKVFWGRCPTQSNGRGTYSLLAEKDRKATLEEIPEEAFPAPGKMPSIPEAEDDAEMDLPPDDLPTLADGPVLAK